VSKVTAIIAILYFAATAPVSPVQAQTDIVVQTPDADYSFGQRITFYLQASSEVTINQANLFLRVQGQTDVTALSIPFEPGPQVSIAYAHSLAGQNLPPFAFVTYWWEVHDEAGRRQRSEERQLYYADNRYDWDNIAGQWKGARLVVHWVHGDVSFGQAALNVAIKSLNDIAWELQAPLPDDVQIYVYPSEEELRSALSLGGYNWAGGQARPELGAILVGIPNDLAAPGEMERLIPHELTHLLVYAATGRQLGRVPPWLDEGLAALNERRPDPNRQDLLEQALAQERLIPLEALCAPFSPDENAARLAYAQSASVVRYLREAYGSQVIRDLLAAYADNASCDAGVTRVLGKNLKGLDAAWRADLAGQGRAFAALKDSAVWLAFWILTVLLVLPLLGIWRQSSRSSMGGEQGV
jgi:hypothetical protein